MRITKPDKRVQEQGMNKTLPEKEKKTERINCNRKNIYNSISDKGNK
jgi:hypothetical protein